MSTKFIVGALLILGLLIGAYLVGRLAGGASVSGCFDECRVEKADKELACDQVPNPGSKQACLLQIPSQHIACLNGCDPG